MPAFGPDFENAVLSIIERSTSGRRNKRAGLVTAWDKDKHLAKVMFQPEGHETGWVPVHAMAAGNGYGHMTGLTPGDGESTGDQVEVVYQEGDFETGAIVARVHSKVAQPPAVEAGEQLFQTPFSSTVKLAKDGSITMTDKGGATVTLDGSGNMTISNVHTLTMTATTINLVGNVHLGSSGGVPAAIQGTVDTGGNIDISNLATKVWIT